MAQLIFLNERSYGSEASDIFSVQVALSSFVDALLEIKKVLPNMALLSSEPITTLRFENGYSIASWFNGGSLQREKARFLLTLANHAPFSVAKRLEEDPDPGVTLFRHRGETVEGIGFASLYGGLPVSFTISNHWHTSTIDLEVEQLLETGLATWTTSIRHASTIEHVIGHREWLLQLRRRNVLNSKDLDDRKHELFPFLDFAPRCASKT